MATEKTIKALNVGNYNGSFEFTNNGFTVVGDFGTDAEKRLRSVSGAVKEGNSLITYFHANYNGGENTPHYDLTGVTDMRRIGEIGEAIEDAMDEINAELIGESGSGSGSGDGESVDNE